MGLGVGIVGLPNVGKSTTFNALTKAQNAQSENYPFCTIEPNKAMVEVPDERIKQLAKIVNPQRIQHSTVDFIDIAGLVKGASKGEGLGNQFLANIREVEVILHIVRCFEDENITHVEGDINSLRDVEIIEAELIFSDIEQVDKKIQKLIRQAKADKNAKAMLELCQNLKVHLEDLKPATSFESFGDEIFKSLNKELRLLSAKTIIYGANVDEDGLTCDSEQFLSLKEYANTKNSPIIKICAKIEEELIGLSEEETNEFLHELGIQESGLNIIIKTAFEKLNLISYFTAGVKEVRSWTIKKGYLAPKAASVIHNDFEKGFIRAEVIAYDDFVKYGGETKAKEAGKMRLEGKEYEVKDGDIMHFRFNV